MTVKEIKKEITDVFISNEAVIEKYGLQPGKSFEEQFSIVSFESIFFYVLAFVFWARQALFEAHVKEITNLIDNLKPHSRRWYANKVLAFQYGFKLLPGSDTFDNSGRSDEEIEASKIVKFVSVRKQDRRLLIKAAREENGDLAALLPEQLTALTAYMEDGGVKDAGVFLEFLSDAPEQLKLRIDIYYNPLVLNAQGARIDGTKETPVSDAVRNYLNTIEFDGSVVLAYLTDALQNVPGVIIPHVAYAAYRYGSLEWMQFSVLRQPQSGYMRIKDEDLTINYIPRNAAQ